MLFQRIYEGSMETLKQTLKKNGTFSLRLSREESKILEEVARQTGLTKTNVILLAVRQFGDVMKLSKQFQNISAKVMKAYENEIAALRFVNRITKALPPDYANPKIDEAIELYYQETGKKRAKALPEKEPQVFDLEIGTS